MSKTKIGEEQLSDEYYDLEIILIDGYVDMDTLNILAKRMRDGREGRKEINYVKHVIIT